MAPPAETEPSTVVEVAAMLRKAVKSFSDPDPFQALGISPHADVREVRKRYNLLVRRYHPHHFSRHGSDEIDALAMQAFLFLQKAHRGARDVAEARTRHGPMRRAGRTGLLAAGARGAAGVAISRAQRQLELHQYETAAEIIEAALKLDLDNNELNAFRFVVEARRCRSSDDLDGALSAYEETLEFEPDNEEALRELPVIRSRLDEGTGLLGRIFGSRK